MISNNYYSELELNNFASDEEIRSQYKKLMKLHHPDKGGDSFTFIKLKSAYEYLIDKEIRLELDNKLVLEEEIVEKSEELHDFTLELEKNKRIVFSCWQCGTENNQKLSEESVSGLINNTQNNSFINKNIELKFSKGTRLLLECNCCSLKYKISRIK